MELSTDTGVRFLTVRSGRQERVNFIVGRATFLRFFGLAFTRACHHAVFRERGCCRHFCLCRPFYRVHGPREIGPGARRSNQRGSVGWVGAAARSSKDASVAWVGAAIGVGAAYPGGGCGATFNGWVDVGPIGCDVGGGGGIWTGLLLDPSGPTTSSPGGIAKSLGFAGPLPRSGLARATSSGLSSRGGLGSSLAGVLHGGFCQRRWQEYCTVHVASCVHKISGFGGGVSGSGGVGTTACRATWIRCFGRGRSLSVAASGRFGSEAW